jgi:hypothetical protein
MLRPLPAKIPINNWKYNKQISPVVRQGTIYIAQKTASYHSLASPYKGTFEQYS